MKDIKRLLYVMIFAAFFVGLFIISDRYAADTADRYALQAGITDLHLEGVNDISIEDVSVEGMINDYLTGRTRFEFSLAFTGDITFEDDQLNLAYDSVYETFDFSPSFTYVKEDLSTPSLTIGDLETVIAGPDTAYDDVFSQYGTAGFLYNTPEIAANNLADAGFDILQTANQHTGDFGLNGIVNTIDVLEAAGIKACGTQRASTDKRYTVISVNSYKIGVIAYTNELTMELGEDEGYAVNTLNDYDENVLAKFTQDIRSMRREGVDFVCALIYAGDSYGTAPEEERKALFDKLFQVGADIVIGNEPFALQPIEVKKLTDADGTEKYGVAAYSLGTFLGSEQYSGYFDNDIGAILNINIRRVGNTKAKIAGLSLTPTVISYGEDQIYVLPAVGVNENYESYGTAIGTDVIDRARSAVEDVAPKLLEDTGYKGTWNGNSFTINF